MAELVFANTIQELMKYTNDENIIEIFIRDKRKRIKQVIKVNLNNLNQTDAVEALKSYSEETMDKMLNLFKETNNITKENIELLKNVSKIQNINLILNGANLCATCAGFIIMNEKLEKISEQINQMINLVKEGNEVQTDYEFNSVNSEHANMLDARKTKKYYTEEQMRKLVDDEYNLLNKLIEIYVRDLTNDADAIIFSIYSLAAMLSVSLRYFDEEYYYNNKEAIGDGDVWHSSHSKWVSIFDKLCDPRVLNRIQDHGILDMKLGTIQTDAYYISLYDQAKEYKQDIEDNQMLIQMFDNREVLAEYDKQVKEEAVKSLNKILEKSGAKEDKAIVEAYEDAMKMVVLA